MPIRHAHEFRAMTDADLAAELNNHHQELFNLRFQIATRKLKNHQRVRQVRREIARVLTVARERELQALYDQAQAMLEEAAGIEAAAPEAAPAVAVPEAETPAPRRRGLFNRSQD
jgi:large subunit ribosomal protein L29